MLKAFGLCLLAWTGDAFMHGGSTCFSVGRAARAPLPLALAGDALTHSRSHAVHAVGCVVGRAARTAARASRPVRMQQGMSQEGMSGERIVPNLGGERVIKKQVTKKAPPKLGPNGEPEAPDRRALIVAVLGTAAWLPRLLPLFAPPAPPEIVSTTADDGDAVTSPALEVQLAELIAATTGEPLTTAQFFEADQLVRLLEARGGSQLYASSSPGRWVIPWVGGWERLWCSAADASFIGGPSATSLSLSSDIKSRLSPGGTAWRQVSARQFVYGPGEGGIHIEYLYRAPGVSSDLLLARSGKVSNRGGNIFQLDFESPLAAFEADAGRGGDSADDDFLATGKPLAGAPQGSRPGTGLELQTTYLSERMWVVRDGEGHAMAFQRTETRSVMDRRGLVADGQLKPPSDDSVRYGGLLFGENMSDYQGWESKTQVEQGGAQLIKAKLGK